MSDPNKYGLSRTIPDPIKREIRQRSKFGCVICRRGFYTYEHIEPTFSEAKVHDPNNMCCLCWGCQDAVTRKHLSKATVKAAYEKIQVQHFEDTQPPVGPLDFHDGNAELVIGNLRYYPAVQTLLRYHGTDLIRVRPATTAGQPGAFSAMFVDDTGTETLRLHENEWMGSVSAWDIEVEGARIVVRRKKGHIALQLRLDPPGKIVVERLDMRFKDSHILATTETYAIGRYASDTVALWMHADLSILGSDRHGAAFEFTEPSELVRRSAVATGSCLATKDQNIAIIGGVGAMLVSHGLCIASRCNLALKEWAMGPQQISRMRNVIVESPDQLPRFIATGKVSR